MHSCNMTSQCRQISEFTHDILELANSRNLETSPLILPSSLQPFIFSPSTTKSPDFVYQEQYEDSTSDSEKEKKLIYFFQFPDLYHFTELYQRLAFSYFGDVSQDGERQHE